MDPALNITDHLSVKSYPVTNLIFPNKTLILVTKRHSSSSSSQQIALLAGMAFIGGILAGLLIRCIYYGIVKYFTSSMDQLSASQRPNRGNANPSFVGDSFSYANDEPPDYVTVMTQTTTNSGPQEESDTKSSEDQKDSKVPEEMPPTYISIVSNFARVVRSAST